VAISGTKIDYNTSVTCLYTIQKVCNDV